MKTCYICRDTTEVLNKICVCEDSYICLDCLELTNENINDNTNFNENRLKCPICRRFFKFSLLGSSKYYLNLFYLWFIKIFGIVVSITPIIIIYNESNQKYPDKIYSNKDSFLYSCILQVITLKYVTTTLVIDLSDYENKKDDIHLSLIIEYIYLIINSIFSIIFLIYKSSNNAEIYTLLTLVPSYYIPFFSIVLISMCISYMDLVTYLRKEFCKKSIQIINIFHNNNNISNC